MLVRMTHIDDGALTAAWRLRDAHSRTKVHQGLVKIARSIVRQCVLYDNGNRLLALCAQNIIKYAVQTGINPQYIAIDGHLWLAISHG